MKKHFGQNFIYDTNLLAAIASDAGIDGENVLEIGMGAGTLTEQLAKRAKKVVGYEIDTDLKPALEERLKAFENVEMRFCDFMECPSNDFESELGGDYKVVANLPYYITTPIICKFLEEAKRVKSITVMVQEEVAERFCAAPGTKAYGAISVALQIAADPKITRRVNRNMFVPAPNVDSAVVHAVFDRSKAQPANPAFLRRVTKAAFAMRRKTLANNLAAGLNLNKAEAERLLADCGFGKDIRGETLSPAEFIKLSLAAEGYLAAKNGY